MLVSVGLLLWPFAILIPIFWSPDVSIAEVYPPPIAGEVVPPWNSTLFVTGVPAVNLSKL